jgi:hypothetical protein
MTMGADDALNIDDINQIDEYFAGLNTSRRALFGRALGVVGAGVGAALIWDAAPASARSTSDSKTRANGPVTVIGDSSVLFGLTGLRSELQKRQLGPFVADARPGRTLAIAYRGVSTALSYIKSTTVKPAVVLAVGGSDSGIFKHSVTQIRTSMNKVLNALGNRQVAISTTWSYRADKYAGRYNGVCFEAAAARPNCFVVDWAALAKANPKWFGSDGAHFGMTGQAARNRFLAQAALTAARRA